LPGFGIFDTPDFSDTIKGTRIDGLEKFPILRSLAGGMGKGSFSTLAESILAQDPYPVKAAVVWKHNVLAFPNPARLAEALKTLDFIAVSDILPSEMVQFADVVLPDNTYFESNSLNPRKYQAMYPQVALREALPSPYDTKSFGSVSVALLRKMGLGEYAPEGMGGKAILAAQLEALGTTKDEIKAAGGMWGEEKPLKPKTEFGTPSKKIELYSTMLEENGYDPLPRWEPPRAKLSAEYPFHLLIYRKPFERMTQSQNDPVLREFWPENAVLINSNKAEEMGIADGDEVYVESVAGKIRLKAKLTRGIRPDCVAIDHGFGHWSAGYSVAQGVGANDGDLIPTMTIEEQLKLNTPDMATYMEDVALKVYKV
jgi:thiosulfate reductase/polysulfide reductase chain A